MHAIPIAAAALLLLQSTAAPKPASSKPPAARPAAAAAKTAAKTAATDLPVTVTYKGKGTVDATHKVIVWLFTDPNVTSASRPIDHQIATRNNDTVTFKDVTAPVYVFAIYDTTGSYDGGGGPPPAGVPSAAYGTAAAGAPAAVKPGAPIK